MSRGLGTSITSALATNNFRLATLIKINIGSGALYLTDYGVSLTDVDAQVYPDSANVIEVGNASETGALKINSLTLTLTGANQAFIAAFLQNAYIDKQVIIKRAIVDANDNVTDSFVFFDGRIVTYSIEDTERDSVINIDIASHWADFEKLKNRRTNLNSQQVYFPDDLGFEYASAVVKDLRWGRKS